MLTASPADQGISCSTWSQSTLDNTDAVPLLPAKCTPGDAGSDCCSTSSDCCGLHVEHRYLPSVVYSSVSICVDADPETFVADAFAGSSYLLVETFTDNCKLFLGANAYLASGECQVFDDSSDNAVVAALHDDGTASLAVYNDSSCTGTPFLGYAPTSETLSSHSCYKNYSVFYTSTDPGVDSSSSSSTASTRLIITDSSSSDGSAHDMVMCGSTSHGEDSEAGTNATVSITPAESSGGINTGAIVGILVAYVLLCMAACMLCMDRMERLGRRLGLRR
ncbi:hypothetical protein PF005_g12498 [Phytophthora fragariae]|uniref:Uncharacterized protein n=1 Tax=Phytophthora fragariae TaxID=53985 RepID=A0A6A3YU19_9STRA|nr:hypothetical protein PF011_g12128 [Phytophthora fragariae]KAE9107991.1 hypothetical protein PF007_g12830 [Phytophthora fragariae]KAE9142503.1 hypothetical protein PF006_g12392 [Phytophthora fragariae]KAE9207708.1 hypothetical protein PF005_g12498 [Phytophthora fragariae]KAE9224165.1 hypothetical protein PF004_g12304 [Phytophthora fragariae]